MTISALAHPALATGSARAITLGLIVCRAVLIAALVTYVGSVIEIGTSHTGLVLGAMAGIVASTLLAFSRLSQRGFFLTLLLAGLAYFVLHQAIVWLPRGGSDEIFAPYTWLQHAQLVLLLVAVGFV